MSLLYAGASTVFVAAATVAGGFLAVKYGAKLVKKAWDRQDEQDHLTAERGTRSDGKIRTRSSLGRKGLGETEAVLSVEF